MKSKFKYSSSGSETGCRPSGLSRRPVVPTDNDPDELLVLGFALVWVLVWIDDGYKRGNFFICFVTTCRVWYVNPSRCCEQREQKHLIAVPASTWLQHSSSLDGWWWCSTSLRMCIPIERD
jgi:hypothetical protein